MDPNWCPCHGNEPVPCYLRGDKNAIISRELCSCTVLYFSDRKRWHPPGVPVTVRHQPGCELKSFSWTPGAVQKEKEKPVKKPKRQKVKVPVISMNLKL